MSMQSAQEFSLNSAIEKLCNLENLPNGWRYGGGIALDRAVCKNVRLLLEHGDKSGISEFDVFPCEDGSAEAHFYAEDRTLEVGILNNGHFQIRSYEGDEIKKSTVVTSRAEVFIHILEFSPKWSSIASYIPLNGLQESSASHQVHLKTVPAKLVESLLFAKPAQSPVPEMFLNLCATELESIILNGQPQPIYGSSIPQTWKVIYNSTTSQMTLETFAITTYEDFLTTEQPKCSSSILAEVNQKTLCSVLV